MRRIAFILCCSVFLAAPALAAPDAGPTAKDVKEMPAASPAPADAGPTPAKAEPAKKATAEEAKPVPPRAQPETMTEAIKEVGALVEAARNGNWVLFTGILIMLLIYILDKLVKLKERIPAKAVPWVSAALGIVGSIAAQLTTGIPWGQALLQGFTAGLAAVGLWELIFKHLVKKKPDPAPAS